MIAVGVAAAVCLAVAGAYTAWWLVTSFDDVLDWEGDDDDDYL